MANYTYIVENKGTYMWVKPESFKDVIPILVDLADNADQIATDTTNGLAVRVPVHVWARFRTYMGLMSEDLLDEDPHSSTPVDGNVEQTTPVKKPRGRPRKNPLPEQEG